MVHYRSGESKCRLRVIRPTTAYLQQFPSSLAFALYCGVTFQIGNSETSACPTGILISKDLKESALRLWEIGWVVEDICLALSISRSNLFRWHAIFNDLGDVNWPPSPLCGPTRTLTHALLTACEGLLSFSDAHCATLGLFLAWRLYHLRMLLTRQSRLFLEYDAWGLVPSRCSSRCFVGWLR